MFALDWLGRLRQRINATAVRNAGKARRPECDRRFLQLRLEQLEERTLLSIIYSANMDSDPGWTESGQWEFGAPTGGGGTAHGNPDPTSGYAGATNVYAVNLNGDYSLAVGGPYYVTTQAIDCSGYSGVTLEFRRWLNTDYSPYVRAALDVSNNGTTWTNVYTNPSGTPVTDSSWQLMSHEISAQVDGQSTVYLRWAYEIGSSAWAYSGWNIDDVVVRGTPLGQTGSIAGSEWNDLDGDGEWDQPDEPGLEGWTVYLDQNDNGRLDIVGAIEPDDYADGTTLNTVIPQATLTVVGNGVTDPTVQAATSASASTGDKVFAHADGPGWSSGGRQLRIDFAQPVATVSIDFISDSSNSRGSTRGYDSTGRIVAQCETVPLAVGESATMTLYWPAGNIAYAIACAGYSEGLLDNLVFGDAEPAVTTDEDGQFTIANLPEGTYTVAQVIPEEWVQTAPSPMPPGGLTVDDDEEAFLLAHPDAVTDNFDDVPNGSLGGPTLTRGEVTYTSSNMNCEWWGDEGTIRTWGGHPHTDALLTFSDSGYVDAVGFHLKEHGSVFPVPHAEVLVQEIDGAEHLFDVVLPYLTGDTQYFGFTSDVGIRWVAIRDFAADSAGGLPYIDDVSHTPVQHGLPGTHRVDVGTGAAEGIDFGTRQRTAAPTSITMTGGDTGVSDTDRVTRYDNGDPGSLLTFLAHNTIPGARVGIYADGQMIGSAIASGTTTTVVSDGVHALVDGARSITARQTTPDDPESVDSPTLSLTIDKRPPGIAGDLEETFGQSGIVDTGIADSWATATAVDSDGKILVGGYALVNGQMDFLLLRYLPDGAPDLSFGVNGVVTTPVGPGWDYAQALAIQPNGKIVLAGTISTAAGWRDVALVRYDVDGELDPTFDYDGKVILSLSSTFEYLNAVLVQDDGKILAGGRAELGGYDYRFALLRFNRDGSLDPDFDGDGMVLTDFPARDDEVIRDLAVQPGGKIVAVGDAYKFPDDYFALARYETNGALDPTFGSGGMVTTAVDSAVGAAVALQGDGKIVVAGTSYNSDWQRCFTMLRYQPNGTLDIGFGNGGLVQTAIGAGASNAHDMLLQDDGKLLVAGGALNGTNSDDFALLRYLSNGSVDSSFGSGGVVLTPVTSAVDTIQAIALRNDGKLVAAGTAGTFSEWGSSVALARYYVSQVSSPDLQADSDTGVSSTDNVTNDTTPTFDLAAMPNFRFYRDGARISDEYEAGESYTLAAQPDGTYNYTVTAVDAAGNESAQGVALSVEIETVNPTAVDSTADMLGSGGLTHTIVVTYTDAMDVDFSTIDVNDLQVTGPGYNPASADSVTVTPPSHGSPLVAEYVYTGPGGSWDAADNGVDAYTVAIKADEVYDTSGNAVAAGSLDTFTVNVENADHHGDGGNDEFEFSTNGVTHSVKVNGTPYSYDATVVKIVNFYGDGGSDSIRVFGTSGDERAELAPGSVDVVSPPAAPYAYEVHADSVEVVRVYAGGGNDEAYLTGSAGDDDTFYGKEAYSYLRGAGFASVVYGFDYVEAQGGSDRAYLYDSPGDDTFFGDPDSGRMELESGVVNKAIGFDIVKAYADQNGNDKAYLTGSDGDDRFYSYETYGYLSGPGFFNYAAGFDYVEADASGQTTSDRAYLYDSPVNDKFHGDEGSSRMDRGSSGTDDVKALGFEVVKAYASGGVDQDEAYLTGSAGDDHFYSYETYSYLKDAAGTAFCNLAWQFDYVEADALGQTSADRAYLYDSSGNDKFHGDEGSSRMDRGKTDMDDVRALGFEVVKAHSSGGIDEAYLTGSSANDRFFGYPTYGYMQGGTGFHNLAIGFAYIQADVGGTGADFDRGYLYDSPGNDMFTGQTAYGEMIYSTGRLVKANDFDIGWAVSGAGDNDTANMWSGTVWRLAGDWENVIPYSSPGGAGLLGVDLDFARWIAALRGAEATDANDKEAEDVNVPSLDYLFTLYGGR